MPAPWTVSSFMNSDASIPCSASWTSAHNSESRFYQTVTVHLRNSSLHSHSRLSALQQHSWYLLWTSLFRIKLSINSSVYANNDISPQFLWAEVVSKATCWCHRLQCGVKNTFGILVYSKEYTFPILSSPVCFVVASRDARNISH
jgi:hypothetical protein